MKKMYFLKSLLFIAALVVTGSLFSQTARVVEFAEVAAPVYVEPGATSGEMEPFPWLFRNCASWGDYNNDGHLDLLLVGYGSHMVHINTLYRNNGDGTFTKFPGAPAIPGTPIGWMDQCSAVWFDFNNDGNLDLIMSGSDDQGRFTTVFKNLGPDHDYEFEMVFDTDFEYVDNGGEGRTQRYVVVGDYDNDGWVDVFIQGDSGDGRVASLYRNLQGTGFQKVATPVNGTDEMLGVSGSSASWGDWNKDGYLDLLSNGYSDGDHELLGWATTNVLYTNNGDGTFADPVYLQGSEGGETTWFELDNDGYLDIITTGKGWNGSGEFYWLSGSVFQNDGEGNFELIGEDYTNMPGADEGVSVAVGDVNNDGYEDIAWQGTYHHSSIFLNNYGSGEFNRQIFKFTKISEEGEEELVEVSCTRGIISMVDYDGDGWLDVYTSGWQGADLQFSYIMKNMGSEDIEANQAPSVPTGLNAEIDEDGITTFSWNASEDDTTPEEAIKYNLFVQQDDVIKAVLPVNIETGRLKVNDQLAAINTTSYKMSGLTGNYTWGVQAIDAGKATSLFATNADENSIGSQSVVRTPKLVQYFDLTGKPLTSTSEGFVIKKTTYDDGSVKAEKIFR